MRDKKQDEANKIKDEVKTEGNIIIEFPGDEALLGNYENVKVTESLTWILRGQLV